jgi:hypothetical protein
MACTTPLSSAEALSRARGSGRLRVDTGREALRHFDYRTKNCCTNIVMSIAVQIESGTLER